MVVNEPLAKEVVLHVAALQICGEMLVYKRVVVGEMLSGRDVRNKTGLSAALQPKLAATLLLGVNGASGGANRCGTRRTHRKEEK
jgi:hypothetical protein